MSKRKIGTSLLLAFAMMLVFSVAAMAAATSVTTSVAKGKITVSWTADSDSDLKDYTVKILKTGTTTEVTKATVAKDKSTVEITIAPGIYDVEVISTYTPESTKASETVKKPGVIVLSPAAFTKASLDTDGTMRVKWSKDTFDPSATYTVVVKNVTATPNTTVTNSAVTAEGTDSYYITFPTSESTKYEVKVTTNGNQSNTAETILNVFTPDSNKEISSVDIDNGIVNANKTGLDVTVNDGSKNTKVIKSIGMKKNDGSEGNHRTHGEYQNNTNSCASCHQTHTGASKNLLFKDGVYNTCTACHDGTLGFYNVFEHSNAGTFGGTEAGNMSVHMADGSVQVKAAPGGNLSANSGGWVNEFNCASCHSPHGSYSDRLLHYNPNGMGLAVKTDGGIGIKNAPVVDWPVPPADAAKPSILVRGTATNFGLVAADIGGGDPATTKVIYAYDLNSAKTAYVKSTKPWLYGYAYGNPNKAYYTRLWVTTANAKVDAPDTTLKTETDGTQHFQGVVDSHDQDWNKNLKIQWDKGFVYAKNGDTILDNVTKGDIGRAYQVDLDLVEIAKFGDVNGVPIYKSNVDPLYNGTKVGAGVQISEYCASCHTDYLAKSGSGTGTFSTAYRHTTNSDTYTCVRCHYAHGTDVSVMMDAEGHKVGDVLVADNPSTTGVNEEVIATTDYMLDQNPSSALKRYTNMSVCWGCHTDSKAEQLKNTNSYGDDNDPHGLKEQGDMPGGISNAAGTSVTGDTEPRVDFTNP
jgi:predicted CXXCH cytochrome family protein